MKIAIILYRMNIKGGTQRQALFLARELKKYGHDVTFYTFKYDRERCFSELLEGMRVVSLEEKHPQWLKQKIKIFGVFNRPSLLTDFLRIRVAARNLAAMIDIDTEILNPHGHIAYRISYYFKKYNPRVISVGMFNTMPRLSWAYWKKKQADLYYNVGVMKRLLMWIIDWYDARIFIHAQDRILVLDERDVERVFYFFGKKAYVIRSGVDVGMFLYKERKGFAQKKMRILAVAMLAPHRRFEDIIEALAVLRGKGIDASLDIIGVWEQSKDYYDKLVRLAQQCEVAEQTVFFGKVSDRELLAHYASHDVFVVSSHHQSWGLAVFEAMASGLVAVVSRSVGAAQVLKDGETALLVEPLQPTDIAQALERLWNDPRFMHQLSRNGRAFVEEYISWKRYTTDMLMAFKLARF